MTKDISKIPVPEVPGPANHNFADLLFHLLLKSICIICISSVALISSGCASTPNPDDIRKSEAYNKLGSSYLQNGQLSESFIEFQKAIKLDPENKETLNYLGYISFRYKKYDESISYYKRAISADPDYAEALNNLGVTYAELENWDEAIKYFKKALSNPTYSTPERAHSNMGYSYYMKSDYLKAEKALNEALMRNPVFPRAMYILGLVYTKLDNDEKAIKEFKKAIGINREYIDAHWELANAYMRTGEKARALKHLKTVVEKDENTTRIRKASEIIERLKYTHQ